MPKQEGLLVTALVYTGAVILFGVPAMVVTLGALAEFADAALAATEVSELPTAGSVFLVALSVLAGLQFAVEVAALQLGGVEALGRGSPRVALARYVFVSLCVLVVLAAATWIGAQVAVARFGWPESIAGGLLGCAGLAVLYRSSVAFITGLRGTEA